jgi:hypothetical protein
MANFKLKESADKTSLGTALAGVNIIPQTGFIMPFAGTTAPSGWALCDGTGGTPDLRGYFLVGATSSANIGGVTGSNTHTHSYSFGSLTHTSASNTHQAPGYYTNLQNSGTSELHSHAINIAIDTASDSSSTFINWSNGNNTTRTFRSHDHVSTYLTNVNSVNTAGHSHANSTTLGTINHTVSETAHAHNTQSSPSGTTPSQTTQAGSVSMNYIVKV